MSTLISIPIYRYESLNRPQRFLYTDKINDEKYKKLGWTRTKGIAFWSSPEKGGIPVYEYFFDRLGQRNVFYSTNESVSGFHGKRVAFYSYPKKAPIPTIPIYQYWGLWEPEEAPIRRYLYTKINNFGHGWKKHGVAFYMAEPIRFDAELVDIEFHIPEKILYTSIATIKETHKNNSKATETCQFKHTIKNVNTYEIGWKESIHFGIKTSIKKEFKIAEINFEFSWDQINESYEKKTITHEEDIEVSHSFVIPEHSQIEVYAYINKATNIEVPYTAIIRLKAETNKKAWTKDQIKEYLNKYKFDPENIIDEDPDPNSVLINQEGIILASFGMDIGTACKDIPIETT